MTGEERRVLTDLLASKRLRFYETQAVEELLAQDSTRTLNADVVRACPCCRSNLRVAIALDLDTWDERDEEMGVVLTCAKAVAA